MEATKKEPIRFINKYKTPDESPKVIEKAIQQRNKAIELLLKWTEEATSTC